jgi:hypothetical protein
LKGLTFKAEIINVAEYLSTKYAEDEFLNIDSQDSNEPNMNSTVKTSVKFSEELNQSNETSDIQRKAFNTQKEDLEKWESKVMLDQYIASMDRQLITKKTYGC